jgi:DNA-binding helix-hairpin-helix protein with protein kinase domain
LGDLPGNFRAQYQEEFEKAEREHQNLLRRWQADASREKFRRKFQELESLKANVEALEEERKKQIKALDSNRKSVQLEKYLDRYRLERAKISGIGESRKAVLISYGIETAADIKADAISKIPGFGQALTQELLGWRKSHERNFRFNPNEAIDPVEINKVNLQIQNQRADLLRGLQSGVSALVTLRQEILAARSRLQPLLAASWQSMQIAKYKLENWSGFRLNYCF